jgi:hydrogenase nickel incorporation protein HypA/HybF
MHEFSVASSLLHLVLRHAGEHAATRVVRVHVRIGEQSGVEPELLRSAWELVSERSPAAGAELALQAVAVRWECRACDAALAPEAGLRCPACGGPAALASGLDLFLDRVELEVETHV